MRYHIVPLGCQMNQSDAERIRTVLEEIGYREVATEEEADLLGVVACSVRQKSIDRVYSMIYKWNGWKGSRNLLTFVSGCMLPSDREKFLTLFDLVFTINEVGHLGEMIRTYGVATPASLRIDHQEERANRSDTPTDRAETQWEGSSGASSGTSSDASGTKRLRLFTPRLSVLQRMPAGPHGVEEDIRDDFWHVKPKYSSPFEAYVPIQNGCDKFCTFCAVPYTRGREVSRPSGEILAEIQTLVDTGYRSITLLGQNVNSYGLDRRSNEIDFAELLRRVAAITDRKAVWVYFTSPHPRDMTDEVLQVVADHPSLANQIHLPIQSGDDKVLIRMNRNYRLQGYRRVVESVRRILPEATLFTDIIVGFSGETEAQFDATRRAMEEFCYNMAYIALYSPRPGAASARWIDDVPLEEKKRRLHLLTEILERTGEEHNRRILGRTIPVLVEGRDRTGVYLAGRTEGRIPVRLNGGDDDLIGRIIPVTVTSVRPLSIAGEPLPVTADAPVGAATR